MNQEQKISEFMELYKPVQQKISAYCRALAANEDAARDLLQETILEGFEGFEKLRKAESFVFYLCKIARNIYSKHKRRSWFWGDGFNRAFENVYDNASVDLQTDIHILRKAIERLRPEEQELVLMFHIMGFSLEEIQKLKGLTEAALKNRLLRARTKLRDFLSDAESLTGSLSSNKKQKL